jgi:tripartite-type tricarboxylate transporter receptor subunit TctC
MSCEKTSPGSENYPSRTINVVVPNGPGGDTDLYARSLAAIISRNTGMTVIVSNIDGGGGSIGTTYVKTSPADGYTVLYCHLPIILNKVMGTVDYDYSDFETACNSLFDNASPLAINTKNDQGFKNLADLLTYAKANPKKLNFGIQIGSISHMYGLMLQAQAGVEFNLVDAGGTGATIPALLGKQLDIIQGTMVGCNQYFENESFICLGIAAEERIPSAPKVPTFKEQGVDIIISKPYGFYFPKGTPSNYVEVFSKAVEKAVSDPEFVELCEKKYFTQPAYLPGADAVKRLDAIRNSFMKFQSLMTGNR